MAVCVPRTFRPANGLRRFKCPCASASLKVPSRCKVDSESLAVMPVETKTFEGVRGRRYVEVHVKVKGRPSEIVGRGFGTCNDNDGSE